jgi:hypothetical protein
MAIKEHMVENHFPPTIADIRQNAIKIACGENKTVVDVLGIINETIRKYGSYKYNESLQHIKEQDETLYDLIKKIGWNNVCGADQRFMQNHVKKLYEEVATIKAKQDVLPNSLIQQIESTRMQLQSSTLHLMELE